MIIVKGRNQDGSWNVRMLGTDTVLDDATFKIEANKGLVARNANTRIKDYTAAVTFFA